MSDENTQVRAYAIWESEGRPEGRQIQNWEQAVRELYPAPDPSSQVGFPTGSPIPKGTSGSPARGTSKATR